MDWIVRIFIALSGFGKLVNYGWSTPHPVVNDSYISGEYEKAILKMYLTRLRNVRRILNKQN